MLKARDCRCASAYDRIRSVKITDILCMNGTTSAFAKSGELTLLQPCLAEFPLLHSYLPIANNFCTPIQEGTMNDTVFLISFTFRRTQLAPTLLTPKKVDVLCAYMHV